MIQERLHPGKLVLSFMILFGLLFPDFTWNGDTVTVTDQNGTEITEELSGQEIYDGIYSSDEISFSLSFL
ncbi:MAG: hypothetical protein ACI4DW_06945 [Lachnospiraceae bacterium]